MKVRATQLGYYNHIRQREGMEFELTNPKHFSENWMEKIDSLNPRDKEESKQVAEESEKRPRGNPNWRKK